ncbi:MAG: DoxX family protein [Cyclobacteriaceae bacterium]
MTLVLQIVFWLLLLAMAAPMFFFGMTKVFRKPAKLAELAHLGYPVWFLMIVGIAEIASGVLILIPDTRWMGVALTAVILLAAILSHAHAGDSRAQIMTPVYVFLHLMVIAVWMVAAS